jgi:hypothetical protein
MHSRLASALFRKALWVALALGVLSACAPEVTPRRSDRSDASIPSEAATEALAYVASHYGSVDTSFASAATTFGDWQQVEPDNTSGLDMGKSASIYALFVTGTFQLQGGPGMQSDVFDEARVVFDDQGMVLNFRFWVEETHKAPFTTGDPPFASDFDD